MIPTTGTYKLEVWGAQGGSYSSSYAGGKGGYSYGNISLTAGDILYVYVGGQGIGNDGTTGVRTGGFNGGGNGYISNINYAGSGGGGATDIRIGQDSLYARVIVAGGGGGAGSYYNNHRWSGGYGGGNNGGSNGSNVNYYYAGSGASRSSGGTSYYGSTSNSSTYGTVAGFGKGGSANSKSNSSAGGGGGWYGGGFSHLNVGGGGSGYIYTSSYASYCPSGCLLNSNHYLTSASTTSGGSSFIQPNGTTTVGHLGNGYARITFIS